MQISEDLKVHSILIGQMMGQIEMLRERTHSTDNDVKIHGYAINKIDGNLDGTVKNVLNIIENQLKLTSTINNISTEIIILKKAEDKRKNSLEFIKELFDKKRNWILVVGVISFIKLFESINVMSIISTLTRII